MTEEQFSTWALRICLGGLILFLAFIIYDLGKKNNAGKLGMFVLFLTLGLGVMGFIAKILIEYILN